MTAAKHCAVIFDGSTRLGEALVILLRFIDSANWSVQQRVVRLSVLAKSLTAAELAREILSCLCTTLQLPGNKVIASIRDGAAVNGAAVRLIREVAFPDMLDIVCFSHTLDNVGRHFKTPVLDAFGHSWVSLF